MFTRNSSVEPKALEARTTRPGGVQPSISAPSSGEKSVIGNDLKIIAQGLKIISRGILQVESASPILPGMPSSTTPGISTSISSRAGMST